MSKKKAKLNISFTKTKRRHFEFAYDLTDEQSTVFTSLATYCEQFKK